MVVTKEWIENNYYKFNDLYFSGMLPHIQFKTNLSKHTWGSASYTFDLYENTVTPIEITISNYYDSPEYVKIQVLLHEMIHIADYLWHPEHYVRNHKRVSGRSYDAHGWFFLQEAERLTKESGYIVSPQVTYEESKVSHLTERSQNYAKGRLQKALICAVIGKEGVWYFKTDIYKVDYLKKNLRTMYDWSLTIGEFKTIKFYTFKNDALASKRSCATTVRGWKVDRPTFIRKMMEFKATEVFA